MKILGGLGWMAIASLMCGAGWPPGDELPWPDRSGPTLDGVAAAADAQGVPTEWDEATGKNIAWKIPLAEFGHSSPVIGEQRLWLTSASEDGKKQFAVLVDPNNGRVLHQKLVFENQSPEPLGNAVNNYASPSPVLEQGAVYVHFGSYGTARLNPATAEIVWQRRDIQCRHFRGPGSSPVLAGDLLILTFDGIDRQFVMALNKHTGQTVWSTPRTTDYGDLDSNGQPKAEGDMRKAYSTPGLALVGGKWQVISVGSRAAFAYDAQTGKELWTIRHDDFNAAVKPLFFEDLAILNTGESSANLVGLRLGVDTLGDVSQSHVVWDRPKGNSRLSSPVLFQGRVYMVSGVGVVSSVDARTGEQIWQGRLDGNYVASPVVINGRVYFPSEEGITTLVSTGEAFEVARANKLAEGMRATPAVARGALYLRTFGHLYKIAAE